MTTTKIECVYVLNLWIGMERLFDSCARQVLWSYLRFPVAASWFKIQDLGKRGGVDPLKLAMGAGVTICLRAYRDSSGTEQEIIGDQVFRVGGNRVLHIVSKLITVTKRRGPRP